MSNESLHTDSMSQENSSHNFEPIIYHPCSSIVLRNNSNLPTQSHQCQDHARNHQLLLCHHWNMSEVRLIQSLLTGHWLLLLISRVINCLQHMQFDRVEGRQSLDSHQAMGLHCLQQLLEYLLSQIYLLSNLVSIFSQPLT